MRLFLTFLCRLLIRFFFRLDVEGLPERFPTAPLIICANHASQWDPLILLSICSKKDSRPIRFVAKKELTKFSLIRWALNKLEVIFIDRQDNDISALRKILSDLKDDGIIGIFPEGTRVHEISPANMKGGPAFLAQRSKANILVARIESDYKFFSKVKVTFKPIFHIDDLQGNNKKEGRKIISMTIFNKIYDSNFSLDEFDD